MQYVPPPGYIAAATHNIQSQEEDCEGMIKGAAFGTAVALDSSLSDRMKVLCVCV